MTGPIKPSAVSGAQTSMIPEEVFTAFNELITRRFNGRRAEVHQADVVKRILQLRPDVKREQIFSNGWLNVEDAYRAQGWAVTYDRPGYNETYDPFFIFAVKT